MKTVSSGFPIGSHTKTRLNSHFRWLVTFNFVLTKKKDCIARVAKTKALISCVVTAQLICCFVFACEKSVFS